jgi:hypothetical protein
MQFEKVHTKGMFHDRLRSGTADFGGAPHYFSSPFDYVADDYFDYFILYPVSALFMERELQCSAIFKAWANQLRLGLARREDHPALGGDAEYNELRRWLDGQIASLSPIQTKQLATFRLVAGQDDVPLGVGRELEVNWRPMSD